MEKILGKIGKNDDWLWGRIKKDERRHLKEAERSQRTWKAL